MAWRRAAAAYAAWVAAHLVAGVAFAAATLALPPVQWNTLWIPGLFAGVLYGAGQWLVLERLFGRMKAWLIATVIASPFSWQLGWVFGFGTMVIGGWIAAGISTAAQAAVIGARFESDRRALSMAAAWIAASLLGSAIFYFAYVYATFIPGMNDSFALIIRGSAGYAVATGLAVAGIAGTRFNPARSALSSAGRRS